MCFLILFSLLFLLQWTPALSAFGLGFGFVVAQILYMAEAVALKWYLLRRTITGRYHAHCEYALRFNIVQIVLSGPLARCFCTLFAESSLLVLLLKALGAKLDGRNVIFRIAPIMLAGADQIHLGESVALGYGAAVLGSAVAGDTLLIAKVTIAEQTFVADNAIVCPGCIIGKGTLVGVQSYIKAFSKLENASVWSGAPMVCLDPGLSDSALSLGQTTRWQQSQQLLSVRPMATVLSSSGLVPMRAARMSEGMSGLQVVKEDEEHDYSEQNIIGTLASRLPSQLVSTRMSSRFTSRVVGMQSRRQSSAWPLSSEMSAQESVTTRQHRRMEWLKVSNANTLQRNKFAGFSQASMIVDELYQVKEKSAESIMEFLIVPCLLVPGYIILALLIPLIVVGLAAKSGVFWACVYLPFAGVLFGAAAAGLLLGYKLNVGKFRVASYSIYGKHTLLKCQALAALQSTAGVAFLDALMGTRWAGWYLAALGGKVGDDVYLESIPLVATDLLILEDRVTISRDAQVAALTIENGCMDFLQAHISADVSIGPRAYIMPGGTLEVCCAVGALSVAMKGDLVVEGTYAEGSPLMHLGPYFDPNASKPAPDAKNQKDWEEMRKDRKLPSDIVPPASGIITRPGPPKVVLLTGATGFVGGFILRDLLRKERGIKKVYCLVRAKSPEDGAARIKKQLVHHDLYTAKQWDTIAAPRIVILPGDLGEPSLGLDLSTLAELEREVDVIINNGAYVNVTKGYAGMRPSNVGAVLELLRLSVKGGASLHQVSTVGTLPRATGKLVLEEFPGDDLSYLGSGYDRSKWVGEHLIKEAASLGLPVSLLRLGRMGGDSVSGGANESDYCMLVIKGTERHSIYMFILHPQFVEILPHFLRFIYD